MDLDRLLTNYPSLGFLGGGVSFMSGLISVIEAATTVGGFFIMVLGLWAGYYTFRIQRRNWLKTPRNDT